MYLHSENVFNECFQLENSKKSKSDDSASSQELEKLRQEVTELHRKQADFESLQLRVKEYEEREALANPTIQPQPLTPIAGITLVHQSHFYPLLLTSSRMRVVDSYGKTGFIGLLIIWVFFSTIGSNG